MQNGIAENPPKSLAEKVHNPRGIFIVRDGPTGPIYRIETPESFRGRRRISAGRSSSIKKLGRISRAQKRGFIQRLATDRDISRYGPAIVVGDDD